MISRKEAKKIQEIATIFKRNLTRIEKITSAFFHFAISKISNLNGDLTKHRRDEFAEGLCEFVRSNWENLFDPITKKIDYQVVDLEVALYKQNANWTEIFVIVKITLDKKNKIEIGLVFELVVRDIFVTMMDRMVLTEIISDHKRPKRFYHHITIEKP